MTVKVCLVFWVSRHKGIGHEDLPLPDVGSEELPLAEDTAPDDIWVAFVKNCLSLCLVSDGKWTFSVVFAKPCHPLILVCCISLKEKTPTNKKPRKLSVSWLARLRAADAGLSSPGRERVEAPKKVIKKK